LTESQEGAQALVEALVKNQACALLVQNLERLDENVPEESDGVHNTLCKFVVHLFFSKSVIFILLFLLPKINIPNIPLYVRLFGYALFNDVDQGA
jgi:hypothetical protein